VVISKASKHILKPKLSLSIANGRKQKRRNKNTMALPCFINWSWWLSQSMSVQSAMADKIVKLKNYITHELQKMIKGHLFTCIVIPHFHAGLKI